MTEKARVAGMDVVRRVVAPGRLAVWIPEDPDRLLEDLGPEAFAASDERMPYFGHLWPAGLALARHVLDGPVLAGMRALDLGCGVGVVGLAAAIRGARVDFLDWEPRSLDLVRHTAEREGLPVGVLHAGDWRNAPVVGRYACILAADVLYEARNLPAVAAFLRAHLAPDGEALLADPGRGLAEGFPDAAAAEGLEVRERRRLPARGDPGRTFLSRVAFAP